MGVALSTMSGDPQSSPLFFLLSIEEIMPAIRERSREQIRRALFHFSSDAFEGTLAKHFRDTFKGILAQRFSTYIYILIYRANREIAV